MNFTPAELAILAIAQGNLPDTPTPYRDIAGQCGVDEDFVLNLLRRLKKSGAIRRFGASIRHQRAGWDYNAMVAWSATESEAENMARTILADPHVSHAYYRPSPAPDWPYCFYTMIHGRSEEECLELVNTLARTWKIKSYSILRSIRELKKTSMNYFPTSDKGDR